jgi:hypothetical protein
MIGIVREEIASDRPKQTPSETNGPVPKERPKQASAGET